MKDKFKEQIEIIKNRMYAKYVSVGRFMTAELPEKDTMDVMPVKNSRKAVTYCVLAFIICAILLVMSFFKPEIPKDLMLIGMGLSFAVMIMSLLSGSVYYEKYSGGEYRTISGFVESVNRNYMTREITSVMLRDSDGEFIGFSTEPGIDIKKRGQYELCYYESDNGDLVITEAKLIGRISRKEARYKRNDEE